MSDLQFLLSPPLKGQESNLKLLLEKRFIFLRQQQNLELQQVASLLKRHITALTKIEMVAPHKTASFSLYLQYADLLGYSLCDLIAMDLSP